MVRRIYVEKKPTLRLEAAGLLNELRSLLGISNLTDLRLINRYDVEGLEEDVVITIYDTNKKGENKVMFQGVSADVEASVWAMEETAIETSKKEKAIDYSKYYNCSSIGSDEVGTGDYFGPIVVTSSYVNKEDIPFLEELGIRDSKKLDDEIAFHADTQVIYCGKNTTIISPNQADLIEKVKRIGVSCCRMVKYCYKAMEIYGNCVFGV